MQYLQQRPMGCRYAELLEIFLDGYTSGSQTWLVAWHTLPLDPSDGVVLQSLVMAELYKAEPL